MFDVGFWELLIIAVVGLLVIGPERLPKVARTAGYWLGRSQRFLSSVKSDIDREMRAEELKRILKEQSRVSELEDIVEETSSSFREDVGDIPTKKATPATRKPAPPPVHSKLPEQRPTPNEDEQSKRS